MIKARYIAEGNTHTLTVLGHANYAEYGKDIVCAGVSALIQALIGWAENHPHIIECVIIDDQSGEVIIECQGEEDVAAVFYMTAIGVEQIAETYPNHVDIDIIGVAD